LWSGHWAVVTPYSLLEGIWKCLPKFRSHQQQVNILSLISFVHLIT
jgi:hypothetical protein